METVIQTNLILDKPNSKGWYPILCKVCHDHGKKGKRAAFIFTGGGCSYNCFNCGTAGSYSPSDPEMSDSMIDILRAFGIPDIDWQTIVFNNIGTDTTSPQIVISNIIPETIKLPDYFYPLTDDKDDDWCQGSIDYLTDRQIDWTSYPFYCVKLSKQLKWFGRLIIPIFYNDNLVFFQGRDLTSLHVKKYINPSVVRDNIIFGYHNILQNTDAPLYIMEGWFDAYQLNGVAIFGNKMTTQQIQWLNKTNRQKVIIPDKYGDGHLLAKQALSLGWSLSLPDIGNCKDINEAVCTYGLLYTMQTINDNIVEDYIAQIRLNLYCKKG